MRNSAFTILLLFIAFSIHPVSAGALDNGVEMVAQGINTYMELRAEKNLDNNFGVTFGNTSGMELTPSQKLVFMIATAEQHPFKIKWVRDTIASDVVYYYMFSLLIMIIIFGLSIAQKTWPEQVSGIFHAFTGHEGFFDYSVMFITSVKLALLPIFSLTMIDFLISIEQMFSNGLMKDSIEYVAFSDKTAGIWYFESIAYGITGTLFALRIQYINEFTANILKIILLIAIIWNTSQYFGIMFYAWFLSALAMRPLVLLYSSWAVKDIASKNGIEAIAATQADMSLVVILSFVTALVLVTWPIFMLLIKVICDYLMGAVYKAVRISDGMRLKR
jgi:hypothetical protein